MKTSGEAELFWMSDVVQSGAHVSVSGTLLVAAAPDVEPLTGTAALLSLAKNYLKKALIRQLLCACSNDAAVFTAA